MTKTEEKDLAKGEELMNQYAAFQKKWRALDDTIKDERESYRAKMDAIEKELLALGESKRHLFVDDNLAFEAGYLHISNNAVVKVGKKFDLTTFHNAYPEMVDVQKALKLSPIKKAFLDADERKLITKLGVQIDTNETMKVIVNKE